MITDAIAFFRERFGVTPADIERLLAVALSKGGDFADLYFEYRTLGSVGLEEQIVKSATHSITQGVGVRVITAEKTGFAFTDEIAFDSIRRASETAAAIARSGGSPEAIRVTPSRPEHDLYRVDLPVSAVEV